MQYVSTRGGASSKTFAQIVLAALAEDGGLYTLPPEQYPRLDLEALRGRKYYQVAALILKRFAPEFSINEWLSLTRATYTAENFGTDEIVPLQELEPGLGLTKLSEGPTLAFKDLSMQLLARLMDFVLASQNERSTVVVATSGDTGGAAVEAFRGRERVDLFVLYPHERVSQMQRLMMTTAAAPNVHALAVNGTFDDCQRMVKAMFNDRAFRESKKLSGVNSINWARIVAQVVYWVWTWLKATSSNNQRITVVIPTGNLGNGFAAYLAREMGLPIDIILATNENYVLHEFLGLTDGMYRTFEVRQTTSPSMDIQASSNFERLLFALTLGDAKMVLNLLRDFDRDGKFDARFLMPSEKLDIRSGMANQKEVLEAIRLVYKFSNTMIDPHTAVAVSVGLQYRNRREPMWIAETAQPAKFRETIHHALGIYPPMPKRWEKLKDLPERVTRIEPVTRAAMEFISARV